MPEDDPRWQAIGNQLEEDSLVKVVERQVNRLDRTALDAVYHGRGSRPFDPVPLLKMVLYQYLKGHQSPATWLEEAELHLAMQWLGRGYVPSRHTWYDFRDRASQFIAQVHQQLIQRALDEQWLDPTVGVQDGTAMAACASRHRMVNRPTLEKRKTQLEAIRAGRFDEKVPQWVPPSDSGQRELGERMQEATDVLAQRIEKNSTKPSDKRQDPDKIQVSLSDPPAPLGRDKQKVFRPLYTVQLVVAPHSLLVMSYCCDPAVTDVGTLAPMIDKTQQAVGGRLRTMMADSAYCSIVDLEDCRQRNIELLAPVQSNSWTEAKKQQKPQQQIPREEFTWDAEENCFHCPQGHRLDYVDRARKRRHSDRELWESRYRCEVVHCGGCPLAGQCLRPGAASRTIKRLENQELLDAQRKKMADPEIQSRYRLRGQTVERAFGDSKGNRKWTRFHGRGPQRALTETGLMVVAQNLQRLDRLESLSLTPEKLDT